ncbi:GSCOCG00007254001-RA-CDS, partial [Cotesia congregata]
AGDSSRIINYRPISILCAFSKVFEIYLYTRLYANFINHLSPNQHGFIPGRSTITNLLCFSEYVHEALKNALQVNVFYTDLSKAFDKVNVWILISRL